MSPPAPERALQLALVGWGLGDLAMGRRRVGLAWLAAEVIAIAAISATTILLADTTWYLVPFLLGVAFLVAWAGKAIATFRRARALQGAAPTAQPRSPAATIAWLALPLLLWGTGFWLIAAERASPAAVIDRFVAGWADIEPIQSGPMTGRIGDSMPLEQAAALALSELRRFCDTGRMPDDCGDASRDLLRNVRISVAQADADHATAEAQVIDVIRRPTTVFGIFEGSELVPVPVASVLRLELEARPAALGAREWVIVNATPL